MAEVPEKPELKFADAYYVFEEELEPDIESQLHLFKFQDELDEDEDSEWTKYESPREEVSPEQVEIWKKWSDLEDKAKQRAYFFTVNARGEGVIRDCWGWKADFVYDEFYSCHSPTTGYTLADWYEAIDRIEAFLESKSLRPRPSNADLV